MSISHVVCRGYGNGTYPGQIRQVVTRGFFDSAVAPVQDEELPNFTVKANSGTYTFPLAIYFSGETSFSVTGLATGITFDTTTGVLTVNSATASGTTSNIVITGINASGSTAGNPFSVKISTSKVSPNARDYED